jgi:hypothetical protein
VSEYDRNEARSDGNTPVAPGIGYSGKPQGQTQGMVGRAAAGLAARFAHLFTGKKRGDCGPIANADCAEVTNRFLEETFRNFRLHANTPPWQEPPWTGLPFDVFRPNGGVAVNLGPFITIAQVVAPRNGFAIVRRVGQACQNNAAFADVNWRFLKSGSPYGDYSLLTGAQYFNFVPPDLLPAPVILMNGQKFEIQAQGTLALARIVNARIWGWSFQPRTNLGLDSGSAIVD